MSKLHIVRPNQPSFVVMASPSDSIGDVVNRVCSQCSVPAAFQKDAFLSYKGSKLNFSSKVSDVVQNDFETMLFLCPVASKAARKTDLSTTQKIDGDFLARALQSLMPGRLQPAGTAPPTTQQPTQRPLPAAAAAATTTTTRPSLPPIPPERLRELLSMGFSESRCRKALLLNNMDVALATEWIIDHVEDPNVDAPLTPEEMQQIRANYAGTTAAADELGTPIAALQHFENVLRAIALVAKGDDRPRQILENHRLPSLESAQWKITAATRAIWAGERNEAKLTSSLDPNSAIFVKKILEYIALPVERILGDKPSQVLQAKLTDAQLDALLSKFDAEFTMAAQVIVATSMGETPDEEIFKRVEAWLDNMESAQWRLRTANELMRVGVRHEEELIADTDPRSAEMISSILKKVQFLEGM